jgi:aspartate/methionine/tyrosine aminotransferase
MRYKELPRLDPALKDTDPTSASTALYNARKEAGLKDDNLGQCIEIDADKPGGSIAEILNQPQLTFTSGTYDKPGMGRGPDLIRSAAAYASRWYGIPATEKNTLAYNANGRTGLVKGHMIMRERADNYPHVTSHPQLLMAGRYWPMNDKQVKSYQIKIVTYDLQRHRQVDAINDHFEQDLDCHTQGLVIVPQDNPTGLVWGRGDMLDTFDMVEDRNRFRHKNGLPPIRLTIDMPYSMACTQGESDDSCHLNAGLDCLVDRDDIITPWDVVISFSKSYAMASPGFYLHITHPKYAAQFRNAANASHGSGMNAAFAKQMAEILQPKYDDEALEHFGNLRGKYVQNRAVTEEVFAGMVVDGDPNIPAVIEFSEDFLGRQVKSERFEGVIHNIRSANDFVQFAADEHNVIIVNNGDNNGRPNFRVSQSPRPNEFRRGITSVRNAHDAVMKAPVPA